MNKKIVNDQDIKSFLAKKKLFFIGVAIAILLAWCDLFSKQFIFAFLDEKSDGNPYFFLEITSFFNLVKVWNSGVSFGMFNGIANGQIVFSLVVLAITLIMLIWLYRNDTPYLTIAISFIIGGALGNLTDRIHNGAVADFLDFHAFGYHWPAFNLADSIVFIGVAMLLIEDFFLKKQTK